MFSDAFVFFQRLFQVIRVIFSFLSDKHHSKEERLRLFFEKTGGAFLKLGQILSLRRDFLPFSYTNELLKLLDRVPETPFSEMEEVFAREIGRKPLQVFSKFNKTPVASASIGQVYKARLPNGELVAVKIQRPKVRELFESDFKVAIFFSIVLDFLKIFPAIKMKETVAEFIIWTRQEFDYTIEAKNAEVLYEHSRQHPNTIIPKQYPELTKEKVLVQEFIENGMTLNKIWKDVTSGKVSREELLEQGINLDDMAMYLIKDEMRQYFIDGFFHADPHPANLIILPGAPKTGVGSKLVYLDFGIVGEAKETRLVFLRNFYAVANKDILSSAEQFLELGRLAMSNEAKQMFPMHLPIFKKINNLIAEKLSKEMEESIIPWYEALENPDSSLAERSSAASFLKGVKQAEKFGIRMPEEIMLFLRGLAILDMLALQISPKFNMLKALEQFFQENKIEDIEEVIKAGVHEKEAGEKIEPPSEPDWEFFQEKAAYEKERTLIMRERLIEKVLYYAEQHSEIRSLLKKYKK